ncbi:MAG TPA: PqqD family peptide modification chaperone [Pseudolabrys sp.]|nr:PqqD family peptide modification chaperone [Pseudolabrys sp.]
MSLRLDSILVQEPGLSVANVDGRVVILSLKAASYFDFNKVASEIWDMLSTPHTVDEILCELRQHHDVSADILTRDVMTFLESLLSQQLVRTVTLEKAR